MKSATRLSFVLLIRLAELAAVFALTKKNLLEIVASGIRYSPIGQCLIEKSIAGMKEVEYEVMRDCER